MTTVEDTPAMTGKERVRLGLALQGAGQKLIDGMSENPTAEELLDHLRALRVFFDAVDAGNRKQEKPAGPLRSYRTEVFHQLADRRVPRERIADAAGISTDGVGVAFKGARRGRPRPHSNGSEPSSEPARRRPRPT